VRLLLDTHVFIWLVSEPERLPTQAARAVMDGGAELLLSVASIWEMSIKYGLGRLQLPVPVGEYVPDRMSRTGTGTLAIRTEHALAVADLPRHHGDPFDRLLIAQAQTDGLTLVSRDPALRAYDVPVLWD